VLGLQRKPTFEEIYADCADRIYRYCYRLCGGNQAEAEDLVQETFLLAYRGLDGFKGRSSVVTWLYRIALHEWLRRRGPALETVPGDEALDATAGERDPVAEQINRLWLESALARLPEVQRQAVILVKAEGLTHREAAVVLGVPQGTVQFRVHEALKRLREIMSEDGRSPYVGVFLPLSLLERELSQWGNVTAPPALAARVYSAIERSKPAPAGEGAAGEPGGSPAMPSPPAGRPPSAGQQPAAGSLNGLLGRTAVVFALLGLIAVIVAVFRVLRPPAPSPPRPALRMLESMSRVQTAHAVGSYVHYAPARRGEVVLRTTTVEYWFKLPSKYRSSLRSERRFEGAIASDLIVDGGKGTLVRHPSSGVVGVEAADARRIAAGLAPFSFFSPDGRLLQAIRNSPSRVTVLNGELGNRDVRIITVEDSQVTHTERWTLYVDPVTWLILQADYIEEQSAGGASRPTRKVVLSGFEYNLGIPDILFRVPTAPR
jgi:RNA polymerase sigma-70 factor, ECF subfamily